MGTTTDKATSFTLLDRFVAAGGDFLDTANCYAWWIGKREFVGDESEILLGEWTKRRRSRARVFLATKVGARLRNPAGIRDSRGEPDWDRVPSEYEHLGADAIRRAIEQSLRRLQTDYVDLYYAHIDDRSTPLEETLGTLNELVVEGKVRYIGCSNTRAWRLDRARRLSTARGWATYVAWQQQFSYLRPKPNADFGTGINVDAEQLDYLRANPGITLLAYSPLLKGAYHTREKRERYYAWPLFDSDDTRARLGALSRTAEKLNVSSNQLVLAWLLHHQPQVIPVIGPSTPEQLAENLGAMTISLSRADADALSAVTA